MAEDAMAEDAMGGTAARGPERSRSTRRIGALVAGAVAAAAVLAGLAVAALNAGDGRTSRTRALGSAASGQVACPAVEVARRVLPSVVTIAASNGAQSGTGSGQVIREGGYILTNDHVIAVAANGGMVSVLYSSGRTSDATIVGRDPATDLAVLRAADGAKGYPLISIGRSGTLEVGQPVVALGAPLGLDSTVTSGIVSALDRYVPVPGAEGTHHLVGAIQTDAAINPGNSGGALVDCAGRLVGVNSAIATVPNASGVSGGGSVGLGFAIPIDLANPLADQLIRTGKASHPSTGMQVREIPPELAKVAEAVPGLFVYQVDEGGPAAQAGLRIGDIITEIDDQPAVSGGQIVLATLTRGAGDTIELTYSRSGSSATTLLTLAAQ